MFRWIGSVLTRLVGPPTERIRKAAKVEELDRASSATLARADAALEEARVERAMRHTVRAVRGRRT